MPSFFLKSRYVLVTYPQCGDLDPWAVCQRFTELGAECIIAREVHADGNLHLHAFADFGRKFESRKTDVLDVGGRHPNIVPSRGRAGAGYDYAIKDGDVVAGGLARPPGDGNAEADQKWGRIQAAGSLDEFYALCMELVPRDFIKSYTNFRAYGEWRFAVDTPRYTGPNNAVFDTSIVDGLDEWLAQATLGCGTFGAR